jgi:hypothetical protein
MWYHKKDVWQEEHNRNTGLGNEMERFQSMTKFDTWIVYLFIGYEW